MFYVENLIRVFVYKDSKDRLISTTQEPKVELGGIAVFMKFLFGNERGIAVVHGYEGAKFTADFIDCARYSVLCFRIGDQVEARVTSVKEDGKLNLSIREKAYLQMDEDAEYVLRFPVPSPEMRRSWLLPLL